MKYRQLFLLLIISTGIIASGTFAYVNAHGGDIDLIHACIQNNSNGVNLRIVGPDDECKKNETPLHWAIQGEGEQGPQGEQGPEGEQGPQGEQGEPGADGQDGADGLNCWDLNGNGEFDLATEDTDDDGEPTANDCQPSVEELEIRLAELEEWHDMDTERIDDLELRVIALEAGEGPGGPTADTCDQDEDGDIDATELAAYLGPSVGEPIAQSLIGFAEAFVPSSNGNGKIDTFPELLSLNALFETLALPPPTGLGLEPVPEPCTIDGLVPLCDPNSDGTITPEELADFFTAITGVDTTPEEALAAIISLESQSVDTNEDGEINTADELSELNTLLESFGEAFGLSCILGP